MPQQTPDRLGPAGERLAAKFLDRQGYRVIARNWRDRYGELDLVCIHAATLVFCEVKTRRARRAGCASPIYAVGPAKQRQLRAMAGHWLATGRRSRQEKFKALRFDVIGVTIYADRRTPKIEHLMDAF